MLTAYTITSGQIQALRERCLNGEIDWPGFGFWTAIADQDPLSDGRTIEARSRCAEILNKFGERR